MMKRLLLGGGVGIVLGSLMTLSLSAVLSSADGSGWHFRLPLRLEFELGDRTTAAIPVAAEATPIADCLPPSLNAIAEQRATSGSLLSGTLLAATDSASESEEFASALVTIAHEEKVTDIEAPAALEPAPKLESGQVTDLSYEMAASLEATALQLYALATEREQATEFVRADQLRRLARRLRTESVAIQQEEHKSDPW